MDRIKTFCSDYRELFHFALAILVLVACYRWVIPQYLDPRVAFDGWSDMLYYIQRAAVGFAIVLFAWMAKRATHGETSEADDLSLRTSIMHRSPIVLYVLEMISTGFWVLVWLVIMFWGR